MPEVRHGEQLPTHSVVMPYEKTLGGEAVALYNKSRRKAMRRGKTAEGAAVTALFLSPD